jgi:hypothetical protein
MWGAYLHDEADVEAALKAAGYKARKCQESKPSLGHSNLSKLISQPAQGHTQGHDQHQLLLLAFIWGS